MAQYRKESFLRNAEIVDTLYLDVNNVPKVPVNGEDVRYIIEPKYQERPDVLAEFIYGSSRYWWVFAARNPDQLKDPIRDFQSGVEIFLPVESSVLRNGS